MIRKIALTVVVAVLAFGNTKAQELNNKDNLSLKLDFFNPGLSLEYGLTHRQSLQFSNNIYLPNSFASSGNDYKFSPFTWQSTLNYRYYYNLNRRARKGKSTALFSGDFFYAGIVGKQNVFPYISEYTVIEGHETFNQFRLGVQAGWGFQRNYKSGIYIGARIGVTHYFMPFNRLTPTIDFKIGYNIGYKNLKRTPRNIENINIK